MTAQYIRRYYGVPAKRGARVRTLGGWREIKEGTIVAFSGTHLVVRWDGEKRTDHVHPTWEIEYLDGGAA